MMSSDRSFFTLMLPRRPKDGDKIQIVAKLKNKPKIFRLILGVKSVADTRNFEPKMIAFEFKTVFNEKGEPRVTSNWKTQDKWQNELEIDETDWLEEQSGLIKLNLHFDGSSFLNVFDDSNSLLTRFQLEYNLMVINRLQLWGDIQKIKSISLRYDQLKKGRSSRSSSKN